MFKTFFCKPEAMHVMIKTAKFRDKFELTIFTVQQLAYSLDRQMVCVSCSFYLNWLNCLIAAIHKFIKDEY